MIRKRFYFYFMQKSSLFDKSFRILLLLLPFTTLITVYTKEKLGIPGIGFYKELLLFFMLAYIAYMHIIKKIKLSFSWFDWLLISYITIMVIISLFTTGIKWVIYWWRYAFEFLSAFWILYHGKVFLEKPISYYIKLFLYSCGAMLFISWLLKWPLTEDILLYFWYCGNPSNWQSCNWVPPIFHGVDWANVRRFQWILDGPNTMGGILIIFSWFLAYFIRWKKDWYFPVWIVMIGLFWMLFYTYSRSALIGIIFWIILIVWNNLLFLFRKYMKEFIISSIFIGIIWGILFYTYSDALISRWWSNKWHFERMQIWVQRFIEYPLGQWLWSSWPGYRHTIPNIWKNIQKEETFYIPESWYIQQFVEWWIIWGLLFICIMAWLFIQTWKKSIFIWGALWWILIMNFFLHTFESSVLSLILFTLLGILLSPKEQVK